MKVLVDTATHQKPAASNIILRRDHCVSENGKRGAIQLQHDEHDSRRGRIRDPAKDGGSDCSAASTDPDIMYLQHKAIREPDKKEFVHHMRRMHRILPHKVL